VANVANRSAGGRNLLLTQHQEGRRHIPEGEDVGSPQRESSASKLKRLGSAQRAYDLIRASIIQGRYVPGQRMIEERIADEFGLSRTPVREALRMLGVEGLIISERNRGAIVRPLSSKDVYDLYELRACLESLAAERAAKRCTPEDLADLDRAIAAFDDAIPLDSSADEERLEALNDANSRFHGTLLRMADHSRLSQLLSKTVDIPLVFQSFRSFDRDERVRSNLFHRFIRDAIARGDSKEAGRLMGEHIFLGHEALPVAHEERTIESGDVAQVTRLRR
jgi:DNA-binding GntR family transcriptional regulator